MLLNILILCHYLNCLVTRLTMRNIPYIRSFVKGFTNCEKYCSIMVQSLGYASTVLNIRHTFLSCNFSSHRSPLTKLWSKIPSSVCHKHFLSSIIDFFYLENLIEYIFCWSFKHMMRYFKKALNGFYCIILGYAFKSVFNQWLAEQSLFSKERIVSKLIHTKLNRLFLKEH